MKTLKENHAFVKALVEVVDENGRDHVYPNPGDCVYFDKGKAICLIGKALEKLGYTKDDIMQVPSTVIFGPNTDKAEVILSFFEFDPYVVQAAQRAQAMQDIGQNWGDAIDHFFKDLRSNNVLKTFTPSEVLSRLGK